MRNGCLVCRQHRTPTCPLCNRAIKLKVQYRVPDAVRRLRAWFTLPPDRAELDDPGLAFFVSPQGLLLNVSVIFSPVGGDGI